MATVKRTYVLSADKTRAAVVDSAGKWAVWDGKGNKGKHVHDTAAAALQEKEK